MAKQLAQKTAEFDPREALEEAMRQVYEPTPEERKHAMALGREILESDAAILRELAR